jgi:Flp pilus assembly pilin Flp
MPLTKESIFETFHIDDEGVERVIDQIKELVHEGNVRRLIVKDRSGATVIEAPLTVGVVGAVLVPVWAAIAAIATIVADATVVVERRETSTPA